MNTIDRDKIIQAMCATYRQSASGVLSYEMARIYDTDIAPLLAAAEEKGRESMREDAAEVCDPYTHGQWFADRIRAIPLTKEKSK